MPRLGVRGITNSLYFNGAASADIPFGIVNGASFFAATGWIKPLTNVGGNLLVRSAGFTDRVGGFSGGAFRFCLALTGGNANAVGTTIAQPNTWYHIGALYDGSFLYLFVNGELEAKVAASGTIVNTGSWSIGGTLTGYVARARMWNTKLTTADIMLDYTRGVIARGAAANYLFTEGSGGTLGDTSGNGYTATITAATWSTEIPMRLRTTASLRKTTAGYRSSLFGGSINQTANSSLLDVSGGVTVALWVNRIGAAAGSNLWQFKDSSGNDSFRMAWEASTDKLFTWQVNSGGAGTTGYKTTVPVTKGQWKRVLATYDGAGNSSIYVDGVLLGTGAGNISRPSSNFVIFPSSNNGVMMQDIRIYKRTVTAAEAASDAMAPGSIPSPVALFRCNEGTGSTLVDSSGNGLDMTGTSMVWTSQTPARERDAVVEYRSSLKFNGTSDGLSIPSSATLDVTTGLTIRARVKFAALSNNSTLFSRGFNTNGYRLMYGGANTGFFIDIGNGSTTITCNSNLKTIVPGVWYDVVGTYDGTNLRIYVDGQLRNTQATSNIIAASGITGSIGKGNGAFDYASACILDVSVSNRPWTASEVAKAAASNKVPLDALCGRWQLQEGSQLVAYDSSGKGNNGTITGAKWCADVPTKRRATVGGNLIPNGDFIVRPVVSVPTTTTNGRYVDGTAVGDNNSDLGAILSWFSGSSGSIAAQYESDPDMGYVMRLSTTGLASFIQVFGNGSTTYFSTKGIPIQPFAQYAWSAWMKTNYVSGDSLNGAYLTFNIAKGDGSAATQGTTNAISPVKTTTGWTKYSGVFTAAADARYLTPEMRIYGHTGAGTLIMDAWYARLKLTKVSDQ